MSVPRKDPTAYAAPPEPADGPAAGRQPVAPRDDADGAGDARGGDPCPTEVVAPLPEPVRARVVAFAAETLGALRQEEVPSALRTAARFTPAKRARLAATALAATLETDPVFRQRVAERARTALPSVADALAAGSVPAAATPVDVAALAYLARPSGWPQRLAEAIAAVERDLAAATASEQARAERRRADEVRAARAAAKADTEKLRAELERLRHDNDDLRHRLGQARDRARRAESALDDLERQASADVAAEQARAAAAEVELRRLRSRLADAESAVESARRAVREGRSADDVRLWLLLDTLVNAAQGLRRELALPPPASRPADAVGDDSSASPFAGVTTRGLDPDDPAVLDQLLALPGVHLVVDGYNVTKSGYGGLALEAQRSRLVAGLAALAARTNTEVTCVFDGAQVDARVTQAARGVRIRFSAPGETADELIRRLVRAEPAGRPVIVVSSDREVADGVRRAGARPVSATALLRRLERG